MTTSKLFTIEDEEYIDKLLGLVKGELKLAVEKFPPFHSAHEGYAIIREEVDELWEDVKANKGYDVAFNEAIQVAAMAVRYLYDLHGKKY